MNASRRPGGDAHAHLTALSPGAVHIASAQRDIPMVRRIMLTFSLLVWPYIAWAGSPHFVGDPVLVISGDTLTVSGKEAGLGNEDQVDITITADALCINNGGHPPKAVHTESDP